MSPASSPKKKRHFSYRWQLFIPLVTTIWLLIFGMAYWQMSDERRYREETLREQLNLVSASIISAYENDYDPLPYIEAIGRYYKESPLYDRIRISVYKDNLPFYNVGEPVRLQDGLASHPHGGLMETIESYQKRLNDDNDDKNFYYSVKTSPDGRLFVYTVLPFNREVSAAQIPNQDIWLIVLGLAIILTIAAYFSTRYFGKNISLLNNFARRAASDPNFIPAMDYPHDELGDICRQIVHIYNERSKAIIRLKREHRVALHAMEEKSHIKRQLTNNINHELKTPIGVIKGYLDTVVENPDMKPESRDHFLARAREHVDRLVNLINDVSALARLDDGAGAISTEILDYHDVVYNVANDFEESDALKDMEFNFSVPLGCKVKGNYNLLSGMLVNLARNAAAYSKGSECGIVCSGEDANFYQFTFYDNGRGVGEEHIPHLFDRFYRIDTGRSRKTGGTGLGLAIVQNTVLAHKGTIDVSNRPSGGLQFTFTLPKA